MRNKKVIGLAAGVLVALAGSYMYYTNATVSQVTEQAIEEDKQEAEKKESNRQARKALNAKEDKVIVGKVYADGYLKKHGDHYHFVAGQPPKDAIYETMNATEDHYTFNPNDIVKELPDGYVVKHGDHFHFIPKGQNTDSPIHVAHHDHGHDAEDHYTFNPADIERETEDGYIVRHGDHFHFIPKDTSKLNQAGTNHSHAGNHTAHHDHDDEDHYTFNPADIESETEDGYIVRHGDHFHFVPKKKKDTHNTKPDAIANKPKDDSQEEQEKQKAIQAKLDYMAYTYGVRRELVELRGDYIVFPNPEHDYDPTHFHPMAYLAANVEVPVETEDAELDFERELAATAKREGVGIHQIKIKDGKMVVPHRDHDHILNIKSPGWRSYLTQRIPELKGGLLKGDLDKQVVEDKLVSLYQAAAEQLKNQPKQLARVQLALKTFQYNELPLETDSTQGYLTLLDHFAKKYIYAENVPADPVLESTPLTKKYDGLLEVIKNLRERAKPLVTQGDILSKLRYARDNRDEASLNDLANIVTYIDKMDNAPVLTVMEIAEELVPYKEDARLSSDLKERVYQLAYKALVEDLRGNGAYALFYEAMQLQKDVAKALKNNVETPAQPEDNAEDVNVTTPSEDNTATPTEENAPAPSENTDALAVPESIDDHEGDNLPEATDEELAVPEDTSDTTDAEDSADTADSATDETDASDADDVDDFTEEDLALPEDFSDSDEDTPTDEHELDDSEWEDLD